MTLIVVIITGLKLVQTKPEEVVPASNYISEILFIRISNIIHMFLNAGAICWFSPHSVVMCMEMIDRSFFMSL